jgi:hypothetical protein
MRILPLNLCRDSFPSLPAIPVLLAPVLLSVALFSAAGSAQTLQPGSARYTVYQGDKSVGASEYAVQSTPAGYTVTSHGNLHVGKFSYDFQNAQNLDHSLNLVSDQLSGTVNGSEVTFAVHADATGRQFNISIDASGKQTQNTVDRHQHLVLMPDLDAAAYAQMAQLALASPPTSWILIPKQNGLLVPSNYTPDPPVRGRLNGSEIDVQHATVAVSEQNTINVELFYSSDGHLLEADLPEQNFFVQLNGFKLINRPQFTPPRSPNAGAPPAGQNGQQQYPQQQQQYPQQQQQYPQQQQQQQYPQQQQQPYPQPQEQ